MARRTISQLANVELATPRVQESRDFFVGVLGVSDGNLARLDQIRAKYDRDGRFHPWMGRVDQ